MKRRTKIASIVGSAVLAATGIGLTTATASAGDVVYDSCSTAHTVTTDDNGITVICEDWPKGSGNHWMPKITPAGGLPTVGLWDTCPIAGLQAQISGGSHVTCVRAFSDYAWFMY